MGPKKSAKFPPNFPQNFPPPKSKQSPTSFCRGSHAKKGCFLESPFLLCPLEVCYLKHLKGPENLNLAQKKRILKKTTPFWTTVSPHHPFSAPLAALIIVTTPRTASDSNCSSQTILNRSRIEFKGGKNTPTPSLRQKVKPKLATTSSRNQTTCSWKTGRKRETEAKN